MEQHLAAAVALAETGPAAGLAAALKASAPLLAWHDSSDDYGAYPELAAQQGLVCIAFVNAQGRGLQVTPFGGNERRIGTNPIAMAFPNPKGDPFLLDMATCTIAANKVRQAADRGQTLAPGLILDAQGAPTEDPQDFLQGGGMLT